MWNHKEIPSIGLIKLTSQYCCSLNVGLCRFKYTLGTSNIIVCATLIMSFNRSNWHTYVSIISNLKNVNSEGTLGHVVAIRSI